MAGNSIISDEDLAMQLQKQFDEENNSAREKEKRDFEMALKISRETHSISESGSDSDATIDPNHSDSTIDPNESDKDLFEDCVTPEKKKKESETPDLNKKKKQTSGSTIDLNDISVISDSSDSDSNLKESSRKTALLETERKSKQPINKSKLLKKSSTIHEISDSESESEIKTVKSHQNMDKNRKMLDHPRKPSQLPQSSKHTLSDSDATDDESPVQNKNFASENNDKKRALERQDARPLCQYGAKCYRKNPSHHKEYRHTVGEGEDQPAAKRQKVEYNINANISKNGLEIINDSQPLSFMLTKVHGIPAQYNAKLAINIKDLLSPSMGNLEKSCQFNYCIDIPWVVSQYHPSLRTKPLLIVHGATRSEKARLDQEASRYSHVTLCQARLEIMYGTHHTKMMLLLYDNGLRVIIHTANLMEGDWHQKSQGVWASPLFPKLPQGNTKGGDSTTHFKRDLLEYLSGYKSRHIEEWSNIIKDYDMSSARVHIIGSLPGRHSGDKKHQYGHMKLRKVFQEYGPESSRVKAWPVIGQFSSVGSLGATKDNWLCNEFMCSLSTTKGTSLSAKMGGAMTPLQLIFPCKENVRKSLEGYPAGGSIPYSINVAKKQPYLHTFFHQWKSELRGRSRASPHIKTYSRVSPDSENLAWFLVTSSNLSKAAWGALEKNGSQLMIRSYELGVLFLPQHFSNKDVFCVSKDFGQTSATSSNDSPIEFPLPWDLPLTPYEKNDRPWIWDIPYLDKPDTNGNAWCPP